MTVSARLFSIAVLMSRRQRRKPRPICVEAVRAVYRQSSEIPINCKLTVRQAIPLYGSADVVESEPGIFVPILVEASVTSFHVTLANHSGLEDTILSTNRLYFKEQVHFLKFVIRFCSILISPSLMLAG